MAENSLRFTVRAVGPGSVRADMPAAAPPPATLPAPVALLMALKAQIERDAVELESTARWCRDLPRLIEQGAMPGAWEQLVQLLKENGHMPDDLLTLRPAAGAPSEPPQ